MTNSVYPPLTNEGDNIDTVHLPDCDSWTAVVIEFGGRVGGWHFQHAAPRGRRVHAGALPGAF
jgi:hypothetical protein